MNIRKAFKIIGVGIGTLFISDLKSKAETKEIVLTYKFPNESQLDWTKDLETKVGKLHFTFRATKNILIPCEDDEGKLLYEVNTYGEFAQILGVVIDCEKTAAKGNRLKLASPILKVEEVNKHCKYWIEKMLIEGTQKFDSVARDCKFKSPIITLEKE